MTRRLRLILAVSIPLLACDVDFLAVEETRSGWIVVRTQQESSFETAIEILLPGEGSPPLVLLDGVDLQSERDRGHWRVQDSASVDTLWPGLELQLGARDPLLLQIPLVARNGAAVWRQDGDLELPLVAGRESSGSLSTWQVGLVDSTGVRSVAMFSRGEALPTPLVLPAALVPSGAVAAEVTVNLHRQTTYAGYPLSIGIFEQIRIPIP